MAVDCAAAGSAVAAARARARIKRNIRVKASRRANRAIGEYTVRTWTLAARRRYAVPVQLPVTNGDARDGRCRRAEQVRAEGDPMPSRQSRAAGARDPVDRQAPGREAQGERRGRSSRGVGRVGERRSGGGRRKIARAVKSVTPTPGPVQSGRDGTRRRTAKKAAATGVPSDAEAATTSRIPPSEKPSGTQASRATKRIAARTPTPRSSPLAIDHSPTRAAGGQFVAADDVALIARGSDTTDADRGGNRDPRRPRATARRSVPARSTPG